MQFNFNFSDVFNTFCEQIKNMRRLFRNEITIFFLLLALNGFCAVAYAQDNSLKLLYSFLPAGNNVTDGSGNSYNGILKNGAVAEALGRYNVLNLGSANGYVDLTANTGKLIASLSDFTVSFYVYINPDVDLSANGNFICTFANSTDMARTANGNMFLTAKNTRYAISKTHWQNETTVSVGSALEKAKWKHLAYTQQNTTGRLYLNGALVKSNNVYVKPSDLGETAFNFIGRSCYSTDVYLLNSFLSDFRIYNRALSVSEISALSSDRIPLDSAINIRFTEYAKNNLVIIGLDSVVSNINLPSEYQNGVAISWQSSHQSVLSNSGVVTRPSAGSSPVLVTLTATFLKNNISTTREYIARVMPFLSDSESVSMDSLSLALTGNITLLRSDLSLPANGKEGSSITWTSENPAVLSNTGKITGRPANGTGNAAITLTAVISKGSAVTSKTFQVNVAEDEGFTAYLFAYFTGNTGDQESIRFALSSDGYEFKALNKNKPILSSASISSTGGVRDPHILRGENSDYYMVVTDMVSAWGWNSNRAMVLLKSGNLIDWQSSVVNIPNTYPEYAAADRIWAPQTIYDSAVGKYMVYFAMRLGSADYDKIYYAYANDQFTGFESAPKLLFENNGKSVIDADIVYQGGKYHLFFKTEGSGNGIKKAVSYNLTGGYVLFDQYLQSTTAAVEGGCVYRMYNTDKWMLIYDMYTSGAYQFTESMDLENFKVTPNPISFDFTPRHGTVIPVTPTEKQALLTKWDNLSGISHNSSLKDVTVYPNPAKDFLKIKISKEMTPGMEIRIMDLTGKQILTKRIISDSQQIDVSGLNSGVYFIRFLKDNITFASARFIVS